MTEDPVLLYNRIKIIKGVAKPYSPSCMVATSDGTIWLVREHFPYTKKYILVRPNDRKETIVDENDIVPIKMIKRKIKI